MQFNNVSSNMAEAVVSEYPSPSNLLQVCSPSCDMHVLSYLKKFQAYERCTDLYKAQSLLKDILVSSNLPWIPLALRS